MGLLDAGGLEVFQHHRVEGLFGGIVLAGFAEIVDQFVVFIDAEHAVRGQAFDGERPGDAHPFLVLIRFVVEVFMLGPGGDGRIDFLLPGNPGLPEGREE